MKLPASRVSRKTLRATEATQRTKNTSKDKRRGQAYAPLQARLSVRGTAPEATGDV